MKRSIILTTYAVILNVIYSGNCKTWQERYERTLKCNEQCGGIRTMYEEQRTKANWECCENEHVNGNPDMFNPCHRECMGEPKCSNTLKCYCELCQLEEYGYVGFCAAPNETHIKKEECEDLACTGKVKYYSGGCLWKKN